MQDSESRNPAAQSRRGPISQCTTTTRASKETICKTQRAAIRPHKPEGEPISHCTTTTRASKKPRLVKPGRSD
jgi:hypothetical protein